MPSVPGELCWGGGSHGRGNDCDFELGDLSRGMYMPAWAETMLMEINKAGFASPFSKKCVEYACAVLCNARTKVSCFPGQSQEFNKTYWRQYVSLDSADPYHGRHSACINAPNADVLMMPVQTANDAAFKVGSAAVAGRYRVRFAARSSPAGAVAGWVAMP